MAQDAAVGSFGDLPMQHWAFTTVELLARKYKVMAGFPEGTFRGDAEVSRYELSAALTKVVERMETMTVQKQPVPPADVSTIKDLTLLFGISTLKARLDALEGSIKAFQEKAPNAVKLSGHIGYTGVDNLQDTLAPYLVGGLSVSVSGTLPNGVEYGGGMSGDLPAANTGLLPATALGPGGKDSAKTTAWHTGGGALTAHPMGTDLKLGMFSPDNFFGMGSTLDDHWGGGPVGNGFSGPGVSSVRWGDWGMTLGGKQTLGAFTFAEAVTPLILVGGVDYKLNDFIHLKLSADTDQPDWTNLFGSNRASAHNVFGTVDLGTPALGVSLQGGLAKDLLQASGELLWKPWGNIQLGLDAVYTTANDGTVTEVTPGFFLFFPSYAAWAPTLNFGIKEPEILASDKGVTGSGSLLGKLAGVSVVAGWKFEDLGLPDLTLEYNLQQPVLFYKTYDATFAFSLGRDF